MKNWLDSLVGMISPEAAVRRARARNVIQALRRGYDGAKTGRMTSGWVTAGTDANAEVAMASVRLRDRARDLVRNNPYAAKAIMTHASSMIGAGIRPRPKAQTQELDDRITDLWEEFAEQCDADGRTTFYGIQNLMARSMVESGECLLQLVRRPSSFGLRVPLQLRVLECDHLDGTSDRDLPDGGFIQQGIEFDRFGRRAAYWVYPRHPGSTRTGLSKSIRIPASEMLHLFDRLRPGQNRGVTWFAPALLRMRDLDDYDVAELVRKKMEACFVGFVINPEPPAGTGGDGEDPVKQVENLVPGMLEHLPPGRDIRFGQAQYTLSQDGKMLSIFIPVQFKRRGGRKMIVAPDGVIGMRAERDESMIQAVAKAWKWRQMLDRKEVLSLSEIAAKEKIGGTYAGRVYDLSLLAPDIVEAILDGRQPVGLSLRELAKGIPLAWEEQRVKFGFGG
ncbi:MAG: phage portal protein [Magnetococcales bacterium]|nr:phage portal protein [Magnetococcales bacterium]